MGGAVGKHVRGMEHEYRKNVLKGVEVCNFLCSHLPAIIYFTVSFFSKLPVP